MRRLVLILLTNLAVLLVVNTVVRLLGVDHYLTAPGLGVGILLVFSAIVGFAGAINSLLISKPITQWATGARSWQSSGKRSAQRLSITISPWLEAMAASRPRLGYSLEI